MAMKLSSSSSSLLLLSALAAVTCAAVAVAVAVPAPAESESGNTMKMRNFIRRSCASTEYPRVCVASLAPYAGSLKAARASELAKVAVVVSLSTCRNVTAWTRRPKSAAGLSRPEQSALQDCRENLGDTQQQLGESLSVLKHLRPDTFRSQMSDVQTYMSAALTNQDSCLDGFQDVKAPADSPLRTSLQPRVTSLGRIISNALALVNRCADSGGSGSGRAL